MRGHLQLNQQKVGHQQLRTKFKLEETGDKAVFHSFLKFRFFFMGKFQQSCQKMNIRLWGLFFADRVKVRKQDAMVCELKDDDGLTFSKKKSIQLLDIYLDQESKVNFFSENDTEENYKNSASLFHLKFTITKIKSAREFVRIR